MGRPPCRPRGGPTADHGEAPLQTLGKPPLQTPGWAPSIDAGEAPAADPREAPTHVAQPRLALSRPVSEQCRRHVLTHLLVKDQHFPGCVVLFPPADLALDSDSGGMAHQEARGSYSVTGCDAGVMGCDTAVAGCDTGVAGMTQV